MFEGEKQPPTCFDERIHIAVNNISKRNLDRSNLIFVYARAHTIAMISTRLAVITPEHTVI